MIRLVFLCSWLALGVPPDLLADGGLKTEREKALYALGLAVGEGLGGLKGKLTDEELNLVLQGFEDAALGREQLLELTTDRRAQLRSLERDRLAAAAPEKSKGESYLKRAASEPGARRSASGLVHRELVAGTGSSPKSTDRVEVHYHGTLTDGSVFDSSVERGQPAV